MKQIQESLLKNCFYDEENALKKKKDKGTPAPERGSYSKEEFIIISHMRGKIRMTTTLTKPVWIQ